MNKIIKAISFISVSIVAVMTIFFVGKRAGKKAVKNEQRIKLIKNIKKRKKIDISVDDMSNNDLDNELRDDTNK